MAFALPRRTSTSNRLTYPPFSITMRLMKFGDTLQGKISDVDEKGRGLFIHPLEQTPGETRTVVIPFTTPGD